jgi:hypothetical protein
MREPFIIFSETRSHVMSSGRRILRYKIIKKSSVTISLKSSMAQAQPPAGVPRLRPHGQERGHRGGRGENIENAIPDGRQRPRRRLVVRERFQSVSADEDGWQRKGA